MKKIYAKIVVLYIFLIFVVIGFFPSNATYLKNNSSNYSVLNNIKMLQTEYSLFHGAYCYLGYDPSGMYDEGIYGFDLSSPWDLIYFSYSPNFFSGACFVPPNYVYYVSYPIGTLWMLNLSTKQFLFIGGGGVLLNGLDYDDNTGKMYGTSSSNLYEINMFTGEQNYIGGWNISYQMSGIAISNSTCYGHDIVTDAIYIIDLQTGNASFLGYTGLDCSYGKDMTFDRNNDILYLAAYAYSATAQLYICNTSTGYCTFVGNFPGEVTSIAIPYYPNPPYVPYDPYPDDGKFNVPINILLEWSGGDPDPGDTITYDVYFGTSNPPPKVASNLSDTTYNPGVLDFSTQYLWKIIAWDIQSSYSESPIWMFTTINDSAPPNSPLINGPIKGKPNVQYNYTFVASDPEGNDVYYWIVWGDGCPAVEWIGPYASGEIVTVAHTFTSKGTFTISAKAKDTYINEGEWGYLEVSMPHCNKRISHRLVFQLFPWLLTYNLFR